MVVHLLENDRPEMHDHSLPICLYLGHEQLGRTPCPASSMCRRHSRPDLLVCSARVRKIKVDLRHQRRRRKKTAEDGKWELGRRELDQRGIAYGREANTETVVRWGFVRIVKTDRGRSGHGRPRRDEDGVEERRATRSTCASCALVREDTCEVKEEGQNEHNDSRGRLDGRE